MYGFTWRGCPRLALTPRAAELVSTFNACGGQLTYSERRAAPAILVEAFEVIAFARRIRAEDEARTASTIKR